jgi:hypothetical protein
MSYDETHDRPHTPLPHPLWQESDCYWFWDAAQGVGGFQRIGQHPNTGSGHVMLFVFEEGGERYMHYGMHPVGPAHRDDSGQRVASSSAQALGNARMRYRWNEADCEGDLVFEDAFYAPRDWSRAGHGTAVREKMNAGGHLECSGRIRGRLRIGARALSVDALAHRDRSWGPRDTTVVVQHRMFSGTLGPELSFACFSLALRNGARHQAGFVVRNGAEDDIRDARLIATLDDDGLSVLGGEARLTLVSGETLSVPCRARQGFLSVTDGYVSTDSIASLTYAGRTGFCDLEVANNPLRGTHVPALGEARLLCVQPGLSRCSDYNP